MKRIFKTGSLFKRGVFDSPGGALFGGACWVLVFSFGGQAQEAYEDRWHSIYSQFYSQKVSPEEWTQITGGRRSETYTIQKGDTLWDVSKLLFDDSHFWPKLWSLNTSITNPHLIHPDETLGFIPGTEADPPEFKVIGPGVKPPFPPPKLPEDFLKKTRNLKVGRGSESLPVVPVMNNFPSSLPFIDLVSSDHQDDHQYNLDFSFNSLTLPTSSYLSFYVAERPVRGEGRVFKMKEYGQVSHAKGQPLVLKMNTDAQAGMKLVAVQNMGRIRPSTLGVRGPFGHQIKVLGEVEVIKKIKSGFNLYEARVTTDLHPMQVGALIVSQSLIPVDFKSTNNMGQGQAQIIGFSGSSKHNRHKGGFPYSLAFLNRGSGSHIQAGQMYEIRANLSVRKHDSFAYDIPVGRLKIAHTQGKVSTALITEMNQRVQPGDYIVPIHHEGEVAFHEEDLIEETEEGYGSVDEETEENDMLASPGEAGRDDEEFLEEEDGATEDMTAEGDFEEDDFEESEDSDPGTGGDTAQEEGFEEEDFEEDDFGEEDRYPATSPSSEEEPEDSPSQEEEEDFFEEEKN